MITKAYPMPRMLSRSFTWLAPLVLAGLLSPHCLAQGEKSNKASINSSIGSDGTGTIIVEARGQLPEPEVLYTASANATVNVGLERVRQVIDLNAKVIQGKAEILSFGIRGDGEVTEVVGKNLLSWAVRSEGAERFLDLQVSEKVKQLKAKIKIQSAKQGQRLPATIQLTHLTPDKSIGFHSIVKVKIDAGVEAKVIEATGFAPLESADDLKRLQTNTGGQIKISLARDGTSPGPVELVDTTLDGTVHADGKSILFKFRGTARVTKADTEIDILSGHAAVSKVLGNEDGDSRLRLSMDGKRPVYQLVFANEGTFPVSLDFVARLNTAGGNAKQMDFTIATSAIVPLKLNGLASKLDFHRDQESVVPLRRDDAWVGFLPATGRAKLQWKTARKAGEGKLFFSTTGQIEAKVGTGLLRQNHQIGYQVLQGELKSLSIRLHGPGEILDVNGSNIVAWKVSGKGEDRQLDITLSQPITGESQINVRSQTALGAFPVRVEGLRLDPVGAIRHSGDLRLTNLGLVRLEPTDLSGLTQLAPEQFSGKAVKARQVFVYRFPAAQYAFTMAADRIQPEVNISEVVLYQLSETDRVIKADIELDIREAPIREWDFLVPADYSVVSVTGASVSDYVAASEVTKPNNKGEQRNLKVIFGQDVGGRQLVSLHLEKSQPATDPEWELPAIEYPEAKTVRGDIGIMGAPGFRIAVGETKWLVEKPLSYFPKASPALQQAFRIRQPGWSATMQIEMLQRSVQSDVFHLYSLSEETVYGSALINYFVTGSPVSQWKVTVPESAGNVMVDGQDVRTWRRDGDTLIVSLHQPVMGAYTLLVTFEEKPSKNKGTFHAGQVAPMDVQGERGYIQVVSPMQVEINTLSISDDMLKLDALELPAEFRLLSTAPPLGTWQYTERPFDLNLQVKWFEPGTTLTQVVEFSEANTRVSHDGEWVTDITYFVKSRGQRMFESQIAWCPRSTLGSQGGRTNRHRATGRRCNVDPVARRHRSQHSRRSQLATGQAGREPVTARTCIGNGRRAGIKNSMECGG